MDEQLKSNLTSGKHWMRLIYMVLFALFLQAASVVMTVLVVVQFLFALITGSDNLNLRKFGDSLSSYIFSVLQFLIYNSEEKPFPFSDWPESSVKTEIAPAADPISSTEFEKPKTPARAKKKPETKAPETVAPETIAPETIAPETIAPETVAPGTTAPGTTAPGATAPEATAEVADRQKDENPFG